MRNWLATLLCPVSVPARYHFWGSLLIVLFSAIVIGDQLTDRWGYANADLKRDVMARWGAPIKQPAPSALFVASGAVFNTLQALPFDRQDITLQATMNYRKRGLVYFSGFDFDFRADYALRNPEPHAIDIVFVFPIQADRNRILLSDLRFAVNGKSERLPLDDARDKLVWTGRLPAGEALSLQIGFSGRGLERFVYSLDPALPARGVSFKASVTGGENFDYPNGVVPAHVQRQDDQALELGWNFAALESGVPVGLVLPSERSYDRVLITMALRSWAPFTVMFAALMLWMTAHDRVWRLTDAYLSAALYAFFFVLLAYLAAYMNFFAAFGLSGALTGTLLTRTLQRACAMPSWRLPGALVAALLLVPAIAVVFPEHTGLVYTLEILAALAIVARYAGQIRLPAPVRANDLTLDPEFPDA